MEATTRLQMAAATLTRAANDYAQSGDWTTFAALTSDASVLCRAALDIRWIDLLDLAAWLDARRVWAMEEAPALANAYASALAGLRFARPAERSAA